MAKLELRLKYKNPSFGKPNKDGSYGIRNDMKTYELFVDEVPVITLNVEYERFSSTQPNYSCVYISYDNNFYLADNTEYLNKGYATDALIAITESLLAENIAPKISLNINEDNYSSLRVAEKAGYKFIRNNEYSIFNLNAIKMYEEGLEYLKEEDKDIYELQMESALNSFKKYVEACCEIKPKQK